MKKLAAILSSFMMVTMLAACGSEAGTEEKANGSATGSGGDEKKTIRVVTDAAYAPFEYLEGDKIVGFDVNFLNAAAKEAGYDVKLEHVGWDPLFVELKSKRAAAGISAITIDEERKQTYDFSSPYFLSINKILVPEGSDIKSADDLKGKVVAVQSGTTGQAAVEKLLGKNHKDIKKFENNNLAIMELINKGADAVVADNAVVEEYAKNNPKQKLKVVEDSDTFDAEFYGIMFPKGSELKADFDKAIAEILDNGTYEKIYKERFGTSPDIEKLKQAK
ncbi:polar amino acid transport system substrate-binding protein [Peribacillus deserti]|uniref:Polar amino acid transport system substrate-binding protein n=1 Tax=Peribacillus deserti TaxID=673318 RepID=A0ABS2QGB9_9BACI|nr:basic amino acid ABC transporter substrate-binding protein [Peribacillus deserti]MBM7691729.1 polar amino acid transport system substrate-binding protein [Peribacillus deserti]